MILLILIGISIPVSAFQKNLSGNLNQPSTHVITIGPDRAIVDNVAGFAAGDTILIIQMQGVKIQTDPNYGYLQDYYGEPGMHEFMIIDAVNGGNEIVFKRNTLHTYAPEGNIQIVRVPYYNTATVTGKLFCNPWNSTTKKGGVLALIIGRTLKLNADIDMSGSGFVGAKDAIGDAICLSSGLEYYTESFTKSGRKGEGVANYTESNQPLLPNYAKGIGNNWNGGGGGNGRYAGGGGGSNRGAGGNGGLEDCFPSGSPAMGGVIAVHATLTNRMFFGGGGGGSTSTTGLAPDGGAGGGIVIIVTDTIIGNGGKIISKGGPGYNAPANSGSGGGGGGGSIALSLRSYGTNPLEFQLSGGKGGDNPGTFGEGGGGGGGLLFVSKSLTANVSAVLTGGTPGNDPSSTASPGGTGEVVVGFKAILNGFLFNSIRSSVTGDQTDSICSNMMPPVISGTLPIGGTGPYLYTWEKSYDETNWLPLVSDYTTVNYTPAVIETATVWFRRTITDSSIPTALVDISKPVKMIVQPFIKSNIIGTSDTICFAQDPPAFTSKAVLQDGNGIYRFNWAVSLDNTVFAVPANTFNTEGYTPPPALKKTSWYRRTVTSGRCVDSTALVKITVLDTILNNKILSLPEEICFGTAFTNLTATTTTTTDVLDGGDESYRFLWETNVNGSGWVTAPGINNLAGYNPVEQSERTPSNLNLFRRVVKSGMNDVCVNTSESVLLTDYPILRNNIVTPATQTICYNWAPAKLIGSVTPILTGGNGTYAYEWQDSSATTPVWTVIPGATGADYQPPKLLETTRYRRVVSSSLCSDISKSVIVIVNKPITNNIVSLASGGADTTICNNNQISFLKGLTALGGDELTYSYKWVRSPDNATWTDVSAASALTNYNPPALMATTAPTDYYFRRKVTSGACIDTLSASRIKVTVLPVISNNNITPDKPKVCYGLAPAAPITGLIPVSGGDGTYVYIWEQSTDGGLSWPSAVGAANATGGLQPPALTVETQFRRKVVSGGFVCSSDISAPVTIGINPLPAATVTSVSPLQICYPGSTVPMDITITGSASPWKVIFNENGTAGSVNNVTTNSASLALTPSTTTSLTSYSYTYTIGSVEDANGCLAITKTGSRVVDVYKTPVPNAGVDADTCGQVYKLRAVPTVGTGVWTYPSVVVLSTGTTAKSTVTVAPFSGGSAEYWFVWKEQNGVCIAKDSVKVRFYKEISAVNPAGDDISLYTFTNVIYLNFTPLESWETGTLALESGEGSISDPSLASTSISSLAAGVNTFSWTIKNGSCTLKDLLNISVFDIVVPEGFSPNDDEVNDFLVVKGLDTSSQKAEMTIVNGTGSVVFETTSQDWKDWDGKDLRGNDVSEGTYFYILQLTSTDQKSIGVVKKMSGFIILKRYK
jgi:gliding motility-associated-like protein